MRFACFVIDDSANSKFCSACDKLLLVFQILRNISVGTMLFFMSSNFSEGLLSCQSWLNFVSGRCSSYFLEPKQLYFGSKAFLGFRKLWYFFYFFYFWFDCVCSASNNAQSRIGTAPDIQFGKDKKKIVDYRPILSVGLTTFGTDCCTRLNSFVLFIALAWNGYNFDLHKENNSCEICLHSKSSQECANSLF